MKNKLYILIIALACLLTLGAHAFSFRNMTLDFIHISDTHIEVNRADTPYKALSSSSAILKDAIAQINDIKGLDFVMFTGDMVDYATQDNYYEFYRLLSKLKYPSLNAFGSHDYSNKAINKDDVLKIVKHYNPNYVFDKTYYAITPKTDYRIVVLDGVIKDKDVSNGEIPKEQLAFLENELNQNQDKIVVIALHYPPIEPFRSKEHSLLNADELNKILIKYKNPIVVLSGHYHAAKIRTIGNIVYVSTPSTVTYPMAFRHIKITNYKDRVNFKFDFLSTGLEDVKEANRQNVISYSTLAGLEKDRNTEFTFYKKHPKSVRYKKNKIKKAAKETKTSKREIKKLSKPVKQKTTKPKKTKKKIKTEAESQ